MKQEMRKKDRMITAEEAEKILRESEYGILSTVCADGYPYGVPISYVYADGRLYFHHTTAEDSLMNSNIGDGAPACFTVVGATEVLPAKFSTLYESVIAFGTVRACEDKIDALMKLVEKFSPEYREQGRRYAESAAGRVFVYEFEIQQVTGKARRNR